MRYRRATAAGGSYFFTVNLGDRSVDTLVRYIAELRAVMQRVKQSHPFSIVAMVVLPEHLRAIWRLPPGNADYPMRWSLIKSGFSRGLPVANAFAPSPVGWEKVSSRAHAERTGGQRCAFCPPCLANVLSRQIQIRRLASW